MAIKLFDLSKFDYTDATGQTSNYWFENTTPEYVNPFATRCPICNDNHLRKFKAGMYANEAICSVCACPFDWPGAKCMYYDYLGSQAGYDNDIKILAAQCAKHSARYQAFLFPPQPQFGTVKAPLPAPSPVFVVPVAFTIDQIKAAGLDVSKLTAKPKPKNPCECGAWIVGSPHSGYCPEAKKHA